MSNSVSNSFLYHVIWDRQGAKSYRTHSTHFFRMTQAISTITIYNSFSPIGKTIRPLYLWVCFAQFEVLHVTCFTNQRLWRILAKRVEDVCFKSSCRSPWSGWLSILLMNLRTRSCLASCTSEWSDPWMRKSKAGLPVPSWSISSSLSWTTSKFYWSSSARLFSVTGLPALSNRLAWLGCSLLLSAVSESQSFRPLDLSVTVGARRGDFVLIKKNPPLFWTPHFQYKLLEVCYGVLSHSIVSERISAPRFEHDKFWPNTPHPEYISNSVCEQRIWAVSGRIFLAQPNLGPKGQKLRRTLCDDLSHKFCQPQSILMRW